MQCNAVGLVVSTTNALFAPREFAAPCANVNTSFKAISVILPFNAKSVAVI